MNELQKDLALTPTPFTDIVRQYQIDEEQFFEFLEFLKKSQKMSRFAGILRHRNVGYAANAMVVWEVPSTIISEMGRYAAEQKAVSHCYERVTSPEWPYNFYTMIHGRTDQAIQQIIDELSTRFQIHRHEILQSGREFKKQRVDYFSDDIHHWHQSWVLEKGE